MESVCVSDPLSGSGFLNPIVALVSFVNLTGPDPSKPIWPKLHDRGSDINVLFGFEFGFGFGSGSIRSGTLKYNGQRCVRSNWTEQDEKKSGPKTELNYVRFGLIRGLLCSTLVLSTAKSR